MKSVIVTVVVIFVILGAVSAVFWHDAVSAGDKTVQTPENDE